MTQTKKGGLHWFSSTKALLQHLRHLASITRHDYHQAFGSFGHVLGKNLLSILEAFKQVLWCSGHKCFSPRSKLSTGALPSDLAKPCFVEACHIYIPSQGLHCQVQRLPTVRRQKDHVQRLLEASLLFAFCSRHHSCMHVGARESKRVDPNPADVLQWLELSWKNQTFSASFQIDRFFRAPLPGTMRKHARRLEDMHCFDKPCQPCSWLGVINVRLDGSKSNSFVWPSKHLPNRVNLDRISNWSSCSMTLHCLAHSNFIGPHLPHARQLLVRWRLCDCWSRASVTVLEDAEQLRVGAMAATT